MDIGADFEDDFFEKPKEKQVFPESNYEIKVIKPLWFMDSKVVNKETCDVLVALKHQADYHYNTKNYLKAVEMYENCMKIVPDNNTTWKREFMENLARSQIHVGQAEKALEWSLKLYDASTSPDQKVISMNLLAVVCHILGKYEEELEALHHCVEFHQSCPELWLRLGLCYAGLFSLDLPEYSTKLSKDTSTAEECCVFKSRLRSRHPRLQEGSSSSLSAHLVDSTECTLLHSESSVVSEDNTPEKTDDSKCQTCSLGTCMVSSCLIRTKNLIDSGGSNLLGAVRDESIKEKIDSCLSHMEMDPSFIDVASKSLGMDFLPGLKRPDDTAKEFVESSTGSSTRDEVSKADL